MFAQRVGRELFRRALADLVVRRWRDPQPGDMGANARRSPINHSGPVVERAHDELGCRCADGEQGGVGVVARLVISVSDITKVMSYDLLLVSSIGTDRCAEPKSCACRRRNAKNEEPLFHPDPAAPDCSGDGAL